jgi:MFS family permease
VVAFITAACYMGALIGNLLAPSLIGSVGWENMFFLFATVPVLLWLPLWLTFMSDDSKKNPQHLAVSVETDDSEKTKMNIDGASLVDLIRSPPVLAICAAQYGQSWGMIGKLKCVH